MRQPRKGTLRKKLFAEALENTRNMDKGHIKMLIRMSIGLGERSATDILRILRTKEMMDKSYSWLRKYTDEMVEEGTISRSRKFKGKILYKVNLR